MGQSKSSAIPRYIMKILALLLPLFVAGSIIPAFEKGDPPIWPGIEPVHGSMGTDPPIYYEKPPVIKPVQESQSLWIGGTEIPVNKLGTWAKINTIELEVGQTIGFQIDYSSNDTTLLQYTTQITTKGKLKIICGNVQNDQTLDMVIEADGKEMQFNQNSENIKAVTSGNKAKIVINKYEFTWYDPDHLACAVTAEKGSTVKPTSCRCGMKNPTQRIIGGTAVTGREFPWQVLIRFDGNICGGSVISKRFVLTAAHCTNENTMTIIPGADNFLSGKSVNVKKATNHHSYDKDTLANDIAVLELEEDLQFDEAISPVCLPDGHRDYAGMAAVSTGYGLTTDFKNEDGSDNLSASISYDLLKIDQVVADASECSRRWGGSFNEVQNICAASNPGKTICSGDSGGPIQVQVGDNYHIIGVSSYVDQMGCTKREGVYAKVAEYNSWILDIVKAGKDKVCPR